MRATLSLNKLKTVLHIYMDSPRLVHIWTVDWAAGEWHDTATQTNQTVSPL